MVCSWPLGRFQCWSGGVQICVLSTSTETINLLVARELELESSYVPIKKVANTSYQERWVNVNDGRHGAIVLTVDNNRGSTRTIRLRLLDPILMNSNTSIVSKLCSIVVLFMSSSTGGASAD